MNSSPQGNKSSFRKSFVFGAFGVAYILFNSASYDIYEILKVVFLALAVLLIFFYKKLPENVLNIFMTPGTRELGFLPTAVLVTVFLMGAFWYKGGKDAAFTWGLGMSGFLVLLLAGVKYLPSVTEKYASAETNAISTNSSRPISRFSGLLSVMWFLAIPIAPFLLMIVDSLYTVTPDNWQTVLGIKAFLCIGIPVVGVIPLIRYIPGKGAGVKALILAIGTVFPMFFGWHSLFDLIQGTRREKITVTSVQRVVIEMKGRGEKTTNEFKIHLADGRILSFNKINGNMENGPVDLEYLEYTNTILSAK